MKRYLVAIVFTAALSGCATTGEGQDEYEVAQQLAQAGNFPEAIAYLERALVEEPGNDEYAALLARYQGRASATLVSRAEQLIQQPDISIPQLNEIEALLADAKRFSLSLPSADALMARAASLRDNVISTVRARYAEAQAAVEREDWVAANRALQQVQALYPNYEASVPTASRVQTEGTRDYLIQAKEAYDNYEFQEATVLARKAMMLDRNNQMAKQLADSAAENNNATFFRNLAAQSVDQENWEVVLSACEKVYDLAGEDADCARWREQALDNQVDRLIADASDLLRQGYIARALQIAMEIEEVLNGALTPKAVALRSSLIDRIDRVAGDYADDGYYGVAWYLYEMLSELDPMIDGLFVKSRDLQDKITERVTRSIAVFDFKSPSYNQDAGVLIANKLIANLFNNASQDTNILERENLKSILEEMKLGQIGVVSEDTAKEMGRIYGIDVAIMGSVLLFKVDESFAESAETVSYKTGEEIQDNIDFLNWQARNPNPSRSDLADAPQPKIMVPIYAEKQYTVQRAKKVGFIEISFRIVDVSTGQNTSVETIERRNVIEDTGNEGVGDAGVQFDPLEVPTDTEMLQLMADEVVEELSRKVLQPLRNRELSYFSQGEELLLRRKEELAAMEEFVNAVFNERIKSNVNSPIAEQVEQYMKQIIDTYRFAS